MKCKKCHKEIEELKVCPYCKAKQLSKKMIKDLDDTSKTIESKVQAIKFFNNPEIISCILIGLLLFHIVFNAYYNNTYGLKFIFGNLLSFILFIYFILLQFNGGKLYFKYMNILTGLVLIINFFKVSLNIFVGISIINLINIFSYLLLTIFFIKTFFKKDVKNIKEINVINNRLYYYISVFSFVLGFVFTQVHYIGNIHSLYLLLEIIKLFIIICFSRYIYLYNDKKLEFFKKVDNISKNINNSKIEKFMSSMLEKYNFYQLAAFIIFGCGLVLGLIFGSEYSICKNNSYNMCLENDFNISLMFITIGISFFISALLYWMGEVKSYLIKITENSNKKVKKSVKNIDKV